ncbi:MAG: hypothetical protein ABEJ98_00765 [Candidatus Nanohaloarchaea archaeon]
MTNEHDPQVVAETSTESYLITGSENHSEVSETETVIQINRCDCGEGDIHMVLHTETGNRFIDVQVPPQAVTLALQEFREETAESVEEKPWES